MCPTAVSTEAVMISTIIVCFAAVRIVRILTNNWKGMS